MSKGSRYNYVQPVAQDKAVPKQATEDRRATEQKNNQSGQEGASMAVAAALRDPEQFRLPAPQRGRAAVEGVERRGDVAREQLNVRVRPELKRAAAVLAAMHGGTLGDVVEAALVEYIKQQQE